MLKYLMSLIIITILSGLTSCSVEQSDKDSLLDLSYKQKLEQIIDFYNPTYSVSINTSEFIWVESTQNTDSLETWSYSQKNDMLLSFEQDNANEIINPKWRFGTPPTSVDTSSWLCTWWLIYDPCIKLWDPIKSSWWLRFGSSKYN